MQGHSTGVSRGSDASSAHVDDSAASHRHARDLSFVYMARANEDGSRLCFQMSTTLDLTEWQRQLACTKDAWFGRSADGDGEFTQLLKGELSSSAAIP